MYENNSNNNMVYPAPAQAIPAPVQVPAPAVGLVFPTPGPSDIEVRVGSVKNGKTTLLLYKNARYDMRALDAVLGPMNWQCEYQEIKGVMYCKIGINRYYADPTKEPCWVWKQNCGTESNVEKEKGEASDAFKRAATLVNAASRCLYTAPRIEVRGGNTYAKYAVAEITVVSDIIVHLIIIDEYNNIVFAWDRPGYQPQAAQYAPEPPYRGR